MTTLIAVLVTLGILLVIFVKIGNAVSEEIGRLKEEIERLKKDKELADKRASAMVKEVSREDVIQDLRNNKFQPSGLFGPIKFNKWLPTAS